MSPEIIDDICQYIEEYSGLLMSKLNIGYFAKFLEERIAILECSGESYLYLLKHSLKEMEFLINEVTINESYFFREERQFEFLKNVVFPEYAGKNMRIWSAACATGEEAYSLDILAKTCGVNPKTFASDIDSNVIEFAKKGIYKKHSFRNDGNSFHEYLNNYGEFSGRYFTIKESERNSINFSCLNLAAPSRYPFTSEKVDLIFIRNLFIYFSEARRKVIFEKLCNCLADNGFLFFSINEVSGIMENDAVKKLHDGNIYYFRKITSTRTQTSSLRLKGNDIKKYPVILNELCEADSKVQETADTVYNKLMLLIKDKAFEKAHMYIDSWACIKSHSAFKYFFQGLIYNEEKNFVRANSCFSTATSLDSSFWLAFLMLGIISDAENKNENAKSSLKKCLDLLNAYIINKEDKYDFLLNSYPPSYYYSFCASYLEN